MESRRIIAALDATDIGRVKDLARAVEPYVWGCKIGLEFFVQHGPAGIEKAGLDPQRLFLDLKFHDIPNTVAGAIRAASAIRPAMFNVHAGGGAAMLAAARAARDEMASKTGHKPLLLAVTVMTSLDDADLASVGQSGPVLSQVRRLTALVQNNGLDGVVCSSREIAMLRRDCGADFKLVVPGIRPQGAATHDQKRVMSPGDAIAAGADYLVIGRPINAAPDPAAAARAIADSLKEPARP
ncbi:MAG: orotidine-5'-phosphate decarboxylase [Rhodospirillaceae bacterium]|nr:orotidine-5'-phosphate decarboxylase [Rhodospirillaceae bacterium]